MGGMACVLFLVLATLPVAPWWFTALLLVLWLVLFAQGTRWFVPHPRRVAWLPVTVLAVWLPTVYLGTRVLGWGAG
jgi:hypothetical protein